MILRSIRVERFGALNPGFEVADLPDGITVFHGPNEAGKSTLLRALTYGLYQRHRVGGEEVERDILPAGTSLSPRVEIEFEKGGERWRIEKVFLKKKSALLARLEHGQFVPKAQDDEADEALKRILDSEYAGKGKGRVEHRGIGEVLVSDQEGLRSVHSLGEHARTTLSGVLGSVTVTREARGLAEAVERRRDELLTAKGEPRENTEPVRISVALKALNEQLADLAGQREEILALESALDESAVVQADAVARRNQLNAALSEAEKDDRRRIQLVEQEKGARQEMNSAQEVLRLAEEREQHLKDIAGKLRALASRVELLKRPLEVAAETIASESQQLEGLRSEEAQLRLNRAKIGESLQHAEDTLRAAQAQARLAEIEPRLASYRDAVAADKTVQQELEARTRPSQEELDEILALSSSLEKQRAALLALGLRVRVSARTPVVIRGPSETLKLESGATGEVQGMSPLRIDLKAIAKIEVLAPQEKGTAALQSTIEQLELDVREKTDRFGTAEPAKLKKLFADHAALEKRAARQASLRQGLFASPTAHAKASKEAADKRMELEAVLARHPELSEGIPSVAQAEARVKAARQSKEERDERIVTAQDSVRKSQHRVNAAVVKNRDLTDETQALGLERAALEAERGVLSSELSEDKRAEVLSKLRENRQRVEKEHTAIAKELAPLRDAELALTRARRELESSQRVEETRKRSHSQDEGKLEQMRKRGLYTQQAELEEQRAELEDQYARAQLMLDAIRLLAQTFREEEQRSVDAVIAPVAEKVRRMASSVLRCDLRIALDETLLTTGVRRDDHDFTLGQLSTGTQDQIALFTRIAFAELYAEVNGRHVLVLDDPLSNSDAPRRRRMIDVLAKAANKLQVVIFTCREDDYLGLHANLVTVESRP
jgi:ABC-type transport system involved in cytochrome c biogenesis ATPase subunit